MTKCPRCGYEFDGYAFTEIERLIVETIRDIRESPLTTVSTQQIADWTGYHPRTVRYHLTQMKRHGILRLPRGRCSGWIETHPLSDYLHKRECHVA